MHEHTCTDACTPMPFRYQVRDDLVLSPGDRVKFTSQRLGVLLDPDDGQFVGTLGLDFIGAYRGPHPAPRLEGWHLVTVPIRAVEPANDGCAELIEELRRAVPDGRLFVPVHPSQIEAVG